jgi:hypothetical protein
MIDFTTLQGLTIPEGVVTQISDASGRVLWAVQSGGPVILEVEKITSDTYAGGTAYTGEQFILLNIYPKTNGTVSVTYGGLTKTITDTSGAESPNAQKVFFGTFNGVSDVVETPASGELTIEGDVFAYAVGNYSKTSKDSTIPYCGCIRDIKSWGSIDTVVTNAFHSCTKLVNVNIPNSTTVIGASAFNGCSNLTSVTIGNNVEQIAAAAFINCSNLTSVTIGNNVEIIAINAFYGCSQLSSINIPDSVTTIGSSAFNGCSNLKSATFENKSGWWVSTDILATSGTPIEVTDDATNATMLTSTYVSYYWGRS